MQTRTDPPHVPLRHSRWPTHKTPRWLLAAGALILVGAVLVALSRPPTQSQRATDMNDFLHTMTTDIESCAGGVHESLYALRAIDSGAKQDTATAIHIATTGAGNCSPGNNMQLDDLIQYQVHESLFQYHLKQAVKDLLGWVPYAARVQSDVAAVLRTSGTAKASARATLQRDIRAMDAQRAKVYKIMKSAKSATSATASVPKLYG